MELVGERVIIRPLEEKDVFHMRYWGKHKNLLLEDYDFPFYTDEEIKKWYRIKTKSFFDKYYSVRKQDEELIGYFGIKDISFIFRKSSLGIVLDPDQMDMAYGTEILEVFLDYYFTSMRMRSMILEVAEFNKRAYRLYEKVGFRPVGYYLDEFHNHRLDLNNKDFFENKSSFVISGKKIYNYIYKMKLTRKEFLRLRRGK